MGLKENMQRTERLLLLLQLLRAYRFPVRAQVLANELNISVRTVYRDLEILRSQGANIQGEPGLGCILVEDVSLPPLTLNQSEYEALVLGLRWVCRHTDEHLVNAAKNLFHKIHHVLPETLKQAVEQSPLLVGSEYVPQSNENQCIHVLRLAIQQQQVVAIQYFDLKDQFTERRIYPVGLAYFEAVRLVIAWCEVRGAFRNFRVDRIQSIVATTEQYQPSRQILLRKWFQETGIQSQEFYLDAVG